jgi:hypothetical protein
VDLSKQRKDIGKMDKEQTKIVKESTQVGYHTPKRKKKEVE